MIYWDHTVIKTFVDIVSHFCCQVYSASCHYILHAAPFKFTNNKVNKVVSFLYNYYVDT